MGILKQLSSMRESKRRATVESREGGRSGGALPVENAPVGRISPA